MNLSELPKIDEVSGTLPDDQLLALMVSLYAYQGAKTQPASWRFGKESLLHNKAIAKVIARGKAAIRSAPSSAQLKEVRKM